MQEGFTLFRSVAAISARVPARPVKPAQRAGFTILELLVVISIMATLMAVIFGAAQTVRNVAINQRASITGKALAMAIHEYRRVYNQWPVDVALANGITITNAAIAIPGTKNWTVFDMLRANTNYSTISANNYNTNDIHFIDDSTVLAETTVGRRTSRNLLYLAPVLYQDGQVTPAEPGLIPPRCPIVYQTPYSILNRSGTNRYYSIAIDFEHEKVTVSPPD